MTRIYISRETICANQRTGRDDPVIRVEAEGLPPAFSNEVAILDREGNVVAWVRYVNPHDNGNGVSTTLDVLTDVRLTPEA